MKIIRVGKWNISPKGQLLCFAILIGVILRIYVSTLGHNYDFDSFLIVSRLSAEGKNIYANTGRFNYGPVYFLISGLFYKGISLLVPSLLIPVLFRFVHAILLTVVDVLISLFIKKRFGYFPAILFILNPVSIIISGFHGQLDNIAILFGLIAVDLLSHAVIKNSWQKRIIGYFILGISLLTKHVLLFFVLWLALKEKSWKMRILTLIIPLLIMLIGFMPFMSEGMGGIVKNVISYRSGNNAPFFYFITPKFINNYVSSYIIFTVAILLSGILFIKKKYVESLLYYLGILVIFSPSISPQYLVIPVVLMSVYPNIFFILYTLLCVLDFLFVNVDELHLVSFQYLVPNQIFKEISGYRGAADWLVVLLFLGLIWIFINKKIWKIINFYLKLILKPGD